MVAFDYSIEEWVSSYPIKDEDGEISRRQTEWFQTKEEALHFERTGKLDD